MELFALRLYEAERTCDVNIKAQKTPIILKGDESLKLTLKNLFNNYDGNQPVIYVVKKHLNLQARLQTRKQACKQFNEYFGLTGDKAIDVKVRSDLHNVVKLTDSIVRVDENTQNDEEKDIAKEVIK